METHDSVNAMAGAYAEKAVRKALEFNTQLDYSENSLLEVEAILSELAPKSAGLSGDEAGEICKIWGSYLGEVVRRHFGGEWSVETYPGKRFATLTLSVGTNKLFPTMKIHRRLTHGENDSVWSFYKMVKVKLASSSGAKVQ